MFLGSLKNNISRRGNVLRKKTSKKDLSKNFTKSRLHTLKSSLSISSDNEHILKVSKNRKSRSINFRWIVLLVSIYVVLGLVLISIQQLFDLIKNIIVYSLLGFFTFFMSYFGWLLAQFVKDAVRREVRKDNFDYQLQ